MRLSQQIEKPDQRITNPFHSTTGRRKPATGRRRERGSEVLEVALGLPILLMVMFGIYSFARGWNILQTMNQAAREGVRQAVTTTCATCGDSSYSSSDVQSDFVYPALQAVGVNTAAVQNYTEGYRWLDTGDSVCGEYISFQYPYHLTVPFTTLSLTSVTLKTDVQMRLENPPDGTTCP